MLTYKNRQFEGVFLWTNASHGDTLMSIALINRLLEIYPDYDFILGCWKSHAYLAQHLPISLFCFKPPKEGENYLFNTYTPLTHIGLNCQLGIIYRNASNNNFFHWKNMILTWNYNFGVIKHSIPYKELEISLPKFDVNVNSNSIFIENGPTYSGHNDFHYDVDLISSKFPEITFYCTADPKTNNHNVVDLSKQNLIYLQNVIRKCKAYIGKGSGPFFLTCNSETKNMPKALFGFKLKEFGTLWSDDYPVSYLPGETNLVLDYISDLK